MQYLRLSLCRFRFHSYSAKNIFEVDSTLSRIHAFNEYAFDLNENLSYTINLPSIIKMTNAKQLKRYIDANQIPENIRILHALAHIEFNAFLAYADTSIRFTKYIKQQEQNQFFQQISKIAKDEGRHFTLLSKRLDDLGFSYGYLPVISNLTELIEKTSHDLKSRLSAISIIHEGRGMKSIPKLINKLHKNKDLDSIPILKTIQSEQTSHFINGRKWILKMCQYENINLQQAIDRINEDVQLNLSVQHFQMQKIA